MIKSCIGTRIVGARKTKTQSVVRARVSIVGSRCEQTDGDGGTLMDFHYFRTRRYNCLNGLSVCIAMLGEQIQ
jgi:hypothetical protein